MFTNSVWISVFSGYSSSFQVLDDQDQQTLAKRVMKELEMNTDQIKPRSLMEAVSRAKNQLLTPAQFTLQAGSYYEELAAKFYERYQKRHMKRKTSLSILMIYPAYGTTPRKSSGV